MAESLAKERMAAQINEQVTRIVESQSSLSAQSGFDSSERRDAISARHFASEHLPGVKTVRSVSNPETGRLFVAVGIDPTMLEILAKHIKRSDALLDNGTKSNADWQQAIDAAIKRADTARGGRSSTTPRISW